MVVLNFFKEMQEVETFSRYNGGWLKQVTGLDKSKTSGYSLLGDFVKAGDYSMNYEVGLYLDCSKTGSRKNQEFNYHLLKITEDGSIQILQTLVDVGRNYAVDLWETIEEELSSSEELTAQDIINQIYEMAPNKELLREVSLKLCKSTRTYLWNRLECVDLEPFKKHSELKDMPIEGAVLEAYARYLTDNGEEFIGNPQGNNHCDRLSAFRHQTIINNTIYLLGRDGDIVYIKEIGKL